MRQPKINRERAARVTFALKVAGYEVDDDPKAALTDALCDLRHFADRHALDLGDCDRIGHDHYLCELHPDDIEEGVRLMHRRGDYPILPEGATL
jgi:hypothetical protein